MAKEKKKVMNMAEFTSMGGKACLKKHGKDHYRKMINKRWEKYRLEKGIPEKK